MILLLSAISHKFDFLEGGCVNFNKHSLGELGCLDHLTSAVYEELLIRQDSLKR